MNKMYDASEHIREHLTQAADEGALFLRKLLRGEVELTRDNLSLATQARAAIGGFARYEATISNREQTSVVVSKMLAGESTEDFRRYVKASLPDHPAVREIDLRLPTGE